MKQNDRWITVLAALLAAVLLWLCARSIVGEARRSTSAPPTEQHGRTQ